MKTILRSPVFTVVLFILAAALLGFGTVGAVQAAPRIQSRDYRAEIVLTDIHTALCESSKATDGPGDFTVRNGDDDLLTTMLADNGDTSLKVGKKYVERLAARNTVTRSASERKQGEPIPEYVRATVRTYWKDGNGKVLNLDPKYVKLEFVTDNGWTIDKEASSALLRQGLGAWRNLDRVRQVADNRPRRGYGSGQARWFVRLRGHEVLHRCTC